MPVQLRVTTSPAASAIASTTSELLPPVAENRNETSGPDAASAKKVKILITLTVAPPKSMVIEVAFPAATKVTFPEEPSNPPPAASWALAEDVETVAVILLTVCSTVAPLSVAVSQSKVWEYELVIKKCKK